MQVSTVSVRIIFTDKTEEEKKYSLEKDLLTIKQSDFKKTVASIEVLCDEFSAKAGDDGYFLIPNTANILDNEDAAQIFFRERPDISHAFTASNMQLFAICKGEESILAVCEGMQHEYALVAELVNGHYRLYPQFRLEEVGFYEDIIIRYLPVDDGDWCAIARKYREYQLGRGACKTLAERVKYNDVLKQAADGIEVRCRLAMKESTGTTPDGWLDFPKEQTPETEPDLQIFADFERMEKVMEELHKSGVENANFCLVGWNTGGMDGRNPDFGIEDRLGGEKGLTKLIKKAKDLGYLIGAHTNTMISFTISEILDQNDFLLDSDGTNYIWGISMGGNCHVLCDKQSYEHYVKDTQKKLKELGFRGINFFDQITIYKPRTCFNPAHPLNKKEVVEYRKKILECGRDAVGCSSSEGGYDFCIGSYDWAMYPVNTHPNIYMHEICDTTIPFWYVVYHGIILYNAFPKTVNAMFKGPDYELLGVEYGARPLVYLHGRTFEYHGEPNFTCTTDEELKANAKIIGDGYRRYRELSDLQYEFFEEHKILEEGVVYTRYSNGTVIIINYKEDEYVYEGNTVKGKSYLRIDN